MIKTKIRDFCANLLAKWMTRFAFDPTYFELWERHGFHVEPVGFYSTLPDTRELGDGLFVRESAMAGLDFMSVFKSYSHHTKWPASLWMRRK